MSKQFWGIIVAVIVVFVAIFALTGNKSGDSPSGKGGSSTLTQHTEGDGKDKITLVEYGDYECPYCGQYYSIVQQVQQEYNTQVTFQFRNFPLTSLHPNAFAAARAAEAAGLQNKYWQMHDLLYQENVISQESSSTPTWVNASDPTTFFDQYAQQIGLNVTKFKTDYASSRVNDLINADMAEGTKLKVQGTPTFFLDGKQVSVGESAAAFEKVINAEIAKKTGKAAPSTGSSATGAGSTAQTKGTATQQ